MKTTIIAAAIALVITGCSTEKEFLAATKSQEAQTKMVLDYHKDINLRRIDKAAEVEIAKSKAIVAKAEADKYRYGAFIKVAEKADAGGRVAMARSLEDKDPLLAAAFGPAPKEEQAAAINIPTVAMPKSAAQEAKEWVGIGLQAVGIGVQGFLGAKNISAGVAINKQNTDAQVANTAATMGAFSNFSLNATNQAIAGFGSIERTGIAGLGSVERTAGAGFGSLERVAIRGIDKTTYDITVNGNDNTLFGSTSNRNYTNNCESGDGGRGGNSAPGGASGNNATAGTTGAGGSNTAGAGAASGSVPCSIQK